MQTFEEILKNALATGEKLLTVLEAEEFEVANEMTDEWGKTILSIFSKEWSEEDIVAQNDLVQQLLALQDTLTKEAEKAREKLSKLRKEQSEKTKAASAYQQAGNTFAD